MTQAPTAAPEQAASETEEVSKVEVTPRAIVSTGIDRAEVDLQVATAQKFPRSASRVIAEAETMATENRETAASMFYAIPRKSRGQTKMIEGPSVRLAEIMASCWGNLRAEARCVGEDDRFVYSEAAAWDIEKNVAIRVQVRRRIANREGKKYSDDMIAVTANAANAIALRNAIFKVVPAVYVRRLFRKCKEVAVGTQKTLDARRTQMFDHFAKLGVPEERILTTLDVEGPEDIGLQHIGYLLGIATAIREDELSIDTAFPPPEAMPGSGDGSRMSFRDQSKPQTPDGKPDPATQAKAAEQVQGLQDADKAAQEPPAGKADPEAAPAPATQQAPAEPAETPSEQPPAPPAAPENQPPAAQGEGGELFDGKANPDGQSGQSDDF